MKIYCMYPIRKRKNHPDIEKYGCGWSKEICSIEKIPIKCPDCGMADLGIENDPEWHSLCKFWASQNGWESRSVDYNIPRWMYFESMNNYRKYEKFKEIIIDYEKLAQYVNPNDALFTANYLKLIGLFDQNSFSMPEEILNKYPILQKLMNNLKSYILQGRWVAD